MFLFFQLLDSAQDYLTEDQIDFLSEAYLFAADAHELQIRSSGDHYISHPVAVATILAKMRMDVEMLAAALMHDVVEDTDISLEEIESIFGEKVARLVDGVTKLTHLSGMGRARMQAESFRKMILAMTGDIRVILIKLADRLHNTQSLNILKPEKRRRIGKETMEIYAPIANRLGMHAIKSQLENLSFEGIYPLRYRTLKQCVRTAVGHRKRLFEKIQNLLEDALNKFSESSEFSGKITGREKRLFSIYKKMRHKGLSFSEIMDVYAYRVVVNSIPDCYQMLGVVHGIFKPVPGRFKDYIAIPKANGYQSLHTTLFGPHGVPIEIQIRTQDMDDFAENGIAAHWIYKDQYNSMLDQSKHQHEIKTQEWLQKLLDMQNKSGDSLEFVEDVKIDLFPDEVYTFTPSGDIIEMPLGATVLDFAYAVHTDIGNHCRAAKVNRQLVPFNHVLATGDTIAIIQSKHAQPVPSWLTFVVTGKAKSAIKHQLKQLKSSESENLGQKLLIYALSELGIDWKQVEDICKKAVYTSFDLDSEKALYLSIGSGEMTASVAALAVKKLIDQPDLLDSVSKDSFDSVLTIDAEDASIFKFCESCWPLPGDKITGVLNSDNMLEVHIPTCQSLNNILKSKSSRDLIPMRFAEDLENTVFKCCLRMVLDNKPGALARMANMLSDLKVNIKDLKLEETEAAHAKMRLVVDVKHRQHLAQILRKLRQMSDVMRVVSVRNES